MKNLKNSVIVFTYLFEASSLNYGEGVGNMQLLKKCSMPCGPTRKEFTFVSPQCVSRSLLIKGVELFNWNIANLTSDGAVVQFDPTGYTNETYPEEILLAGYLNTKQKLKREKALRISQTKAIFPYAYDSEFLTNGYLASRNDMNPMPSTREIDHNLYEISIVLRIGDLFGDENVGIVIPEDRVRKITKEVLDVIKNLTRDIQGRTESLSPVFIVGGIYNASQVPFARKLKCIESHNNKLCLDPQAIQEAGELSINGRSYMEDSFIGMNQSLIGNYEAFKDIFGEDKVLSVESFFKQIASQIDNLK